MSGFEVAPAMAASAGSAGAAGGAAAGTAGAASAGAAGAGAGAAGAGAMGAAGAAGTLGAAGAGTAAAGGLGTAAAGGLGTAGIGSTLGGTALGSSTSLGSGLLAGNAGSNIVGAGLGMGGLGSGVTGAATMSPNLGAAVGASQMAAGPGMSGVLGTGVTGVASSAPTAGGLLANAATPSTFVTPFTVSDAMAAAGSNVGKANTAMKIMQPQQPRAMGGGDSGPVFQGQRAPISPFGQQGQSENNFLRYLMQQRSGMQPGLLG